MFANYQNSQTPKFMNYRARIFLKEIVRIAVISFMAFTAFYSVILLIFYIGFNYLGWE